MSYLGWQDSKIPWLRDAYWKISRELTMQRIPIVSMLFSIGTAFWGLLVCIWYNIYKKRKNILVILSLILLLWVTIMFGPATLVRYVLILFFGAPIIVAFCLNGNKFKEKDNNI